MPILVLINDPNNVHLVCNHVNVLIDLIKSLRLGVWHKILNTLTTQHLLKTLSDVSRIVDYANY